MNDPGSPFWGEWLRLCVFMVIFIIAFIYGLLLVGG